MFPLVCADCPLYYDLCMQLYTRQLADFLAQPPVSRQPSPRQGRLESSAGELSAGGSLTQWARARREGPVQGWGGWLVTRPAEWCRWRQWRHCWHSTFSNWRVAARFIRTRHILFETILRFSFHLFCLTRSNPCHANHAKSYCVYMFVDMSMFSDYTLKLTLQPNPIWSNL